MKVVLATLQVPTYKLEFCLEKGIYWVKFESLSGGSDRLDQITKEECMHAVGVVMNASLQIEEFMNDSKN